MNSAGLRGVIVAAWAFVATVSSVSCEKDHTDDPDEPVSYTLTQSRSAKRGVSFNFGTLPDTDIPLLGDAVCIFCKLQMGRFLHNQGVWFNLSDCTRNS